MKQYNILNKQSIKSYIVEDNLLLELAENC